MKNLLTIGMLVLIVFSSCRKDSSLSDPNPTPDISVKKTPFATATAPGVTTLSVGTGSGNLVIDGSSYVLGNNYIIKVAAGSYSSITIQNINLTGLVTIENSGLVQVTGNMSSMTFNNVSNLTVTGMGTSGMPNGFYFHDNNYRPITINGLTHNLTLSNFQFNNIGDYSIDFSNGTTIYDGTNNTCFYNITIQNMLCTNTNQFLQMSGGINNGVVTGLVKNLEITGLNFSNSNCGVVAYVGNADAYNIHNNTINNINQTNNNHNGIFLIVGNGSFHDNLVENHQGNAIRAWGVSIGTTPKNVLIYNNTVHDSRKYSAFEVQSFATMITPGKTTYINAQVYNNLCGNLNLSMDWYGVVVDVYNLYGGICNVYNNKAFNFPAPNPNSYIVSQQATTIPVVTNNNYYPTAALAGISDVNALTIY